MRAVVRRVVAVLAPVAVATALLPSAPPAAAEERGGSSLHLVTLRAGATLEDGESALAAVEAPRPVYRWSRALRGYAVSLTRRQAEELQADPDVELVEPDRRLRLAGRPEAADPGASPYSRRQGGRGTVIGFVDSGLWPDSPLFADTRGLGRPGGFTGRCQTGPGWPASACNGKVAGARWFLAGFGAENLRSSSSVSARDDSGHGTQMASLAAGNADVSVDLDGREAGTYSGVAPRARVAVYKACWTAPDPADDGCSSADVVTAIDRAVADGVDVLNLSVAGSQGFDTVERALLGAAEADVVVVAAAGNTGRTELASHTSPWVTTVGGLTGVQRRGEVRLDGGSLRLEGAMLSSGGTATVRVVRAADAATPGARREDARLCRPGSLDAGAVAGALVACDRGVVGRVDKSAAVARADGVGMILLNRAPGPDGVAADLHAVPTVHLARREAAQLRNRLADGPVRARLVSSPPTPAPPALLPSSPAGDPADGVLKPDLVASASGLLGAVPPEVQGSRWNVVAGTSAAAAQVSGLAARLRARKPGWSAVAVRSALATAAEPVPGPSLRTGAGRARDAVAGLVFEVGPRDYRRYLSGDLSSVRLNTPSIMIRPEHAPVSRVVTNRTDVRRTWRASLSGFDRHVVTVDPPAMTLAPGESGRFTVFVSGRPGVHADSGAVTWRNPGVPAVRVPVAMGR